MINILDDPFDGLSSFSKVIDEYQDTLKRAVKDKSVVVTKKPSIFYVENQKTFNDALQYYNDLLNNKCSQDCDMQLSERIRDKRSKYMIDLRKLITVSYQ